MKTILLAAVVLAYSSLSFGTSYQEASAMLYPMRAVDPKGGCGYSSTNVERCELRSASEIREAANKVEAGYEAAVTEGLEKAKVLDTEADLLEESLSLEAEGSPLSEIIKKAVGALRSKSRQYQEGREKARANFENELAEVRKLAQAIEEKEKLLESADEAGKNKITMEMKKAMVDTVFKLTGHDVRYGLIRFLSGEIGGEFTLFADTSEHFIHGRGCFGLLYPDYFNYLKVTNKYDGAESKSDLSLSKDRALLRHILNPQNPLKVKCKKYPFITPYAVAVRGNSYDVKKNLLVIPYKMRKVISFDPYETVALPENGLLNFIREKYAK